MGQSNVRLVHAEPEPDDVHDEGDGCHEQGWKERLYVHQPHKLSLKMGYLAIPEETELRHVPRKKGRSSDSAYTLHNVSQ
jgi:hypothetical protein